MSDSTQPKMSKAETELREEIAKVSISEADRKAADDLAENARDTAFIRRAMITPGMAAAIFRFHNERRNRRLDPLKARDLGGAMSRGEWKENSMTCGFYPDGNLGDGQHRMAGCALGGQSISLLVVGGLDPDSIDTIDRQTRRTTAEALDMKGISESKLKARIIRPVLDYKAQHAGQPRQRLTDQQLETIVADNNDRLDLAIEIAREASHTSEPAMTEINCAQAAFLLLEGLHDDDFIRKLLGETQRSEGNSDGSSVSLPLAQAVGRKGRRDKTLPPRRRLGLICKAASLGSMGKTVTRLAFDPKKEELPDYHAPQQPQEPEEQAKAAD